ncbi:MAG: polyphosphate:AMP phosphotransferase [Verrucomicrobia bacterium]|nr:polyphosphate:AMP phosphotransferase [Verrucomicrobiota bacterium]
MFEAAELGRKISKKVFEQQLPKLRSRLLEAQFRLKSTPLPVIVLISGVDAAGKGEVVHRLTEWLDPRGVQTHTFRDVSDEERERPDYWRFWRALPARGRIGILFGSWYSGPIVQRVYGEIKNSKLDRTLDRIAFFEEMLVKDGAILIKLWLHLSRKEQRKRLKALERDPETRWRVLPTDWKHFKLYDRFAEIDERVIRHTDAGSAAWHLIEATDHRYRDLTAGRIILEALEQGLKQWREAAAQNRHHAPATRPPKRGVTILSRVDLNQALSPRDYKRQLQKCQAKLNQLTWAACAKHRSSVVVFEGWDAAGKGSAIRRVTAAIDPRLYHIVPIAAPTDEERAHHYLWRFWRHLPRAGRVAIFDRSWYGRVLVERVEGFAAEPEWGRAYLEITDFEEQLVEHGIILTKFWLHVSKEEQLRRFKERQDIPYKRYKITEEDWRNRSKWDAYSAAVNEMVARTSTEFGPWTLVAGNDKKFARIQILKTLCRRLESEIS